MASLSGSFCRIRSSRSVHPMNERTRSRACLVALIMFLLPFACSTSAEAQTRIPENTPSQNRHPMERIGKDGAPLIRIPEGEFVMGSHAGQEDERPAHPVYLDAFYIDKYEVTVERYAAFLTAQKPERPFKWREATNGAQGRKPVIGIDWYDAKEYCEWSGRRLPSEAEWERPLEAPNHEIIRGVTNHRRGLTPMQANAHGTATTHSQQLDATFEAPVRMEWTISREMSGNGSRTGMTSATTKRVRQGTRSDRQQDCYACSEAAHGITTRQRSVRRIAPPTRRRRAETMSGFAVQWINP